MILPPVRFVKGLKWHRGRAAGIMASKTEKQRNTVLRSISILG